MKLNHYMPHTDDSNDCSVIALSIVKNIPYAEAHEILENQYEKSLKGK